jgi:hypothetical protein
MRQISHPEPASRIDPQSPQQSGRVSPPVNPVTRSESWVRVRIWARTRIGLFALLMACAGLPLAAGATDSSRVGLRAQGPGTVFETVEAAAIDALSYAHLEETLTQRRSLRVGVIQRVENGYSYTAAKRSSTSSPLTASSVRYRLRSNDVARYIIPPHSGKARIDRYNEEPTRKEKKIVDELDPAHRPLFQLTPSHNIVSYRYGGHTNVLLNLSDLAALNNEAPVSDVDSGPPTLDTPSQI